jgi:hypothetical protein
VDGRRCTLYTTDASMTRRLMCQSVRQLMQKDIAASFWILKLNFWIKNEIFIRKLELLLAVVDLLKEICIKILSKFRSFHKNSWFEWESESVFWVIFTLFWDMVQKVEIWEAHKPIRGPRAIVILSLSKIHSIHPKQK